MCLAWLQVEVVQNTSKTTAQLLEHQLEAARLSLVQLEQDFKVSGREGQRGRRGCAPWGCLVRRAKAQ